MNLYKKIFKKSVPEVKIEIKEFNPETDTLLISIPGATEEDIKRAVKVLDMALEKKSTFAVNSDIKLIVLKNRKKKWLKKHQL